MLEFAKTLPEALVIIQSNPAALIAAVAMTAFGVVGLALYVVLKIGGKK